MAMTVTMDKKTNKLTVTIDCNPEPVTSTSGKSKIVATSGGNQKFSIDGKELRVGLNAYIPVAGAAV